jgi:hypothetical protein
MELGTQKPKERGFDPITRIPVQAWAGPGGYRRLRLRDIKTVGTWRWLSCLPYAPTAFTTQEIFLVLISVRGWIDPRNICQ